MNRLLSYLPVVYHDVKEYQEISRVSQKNIDDLQHEIDRFLDNQFVMTSDDYGLSRREKDLKIKANKEIETLDFRRKRIINRYTTRPPFTIRYLRGQLDRLVGKGRTSVTVNASEYLLTVVTSIDDAPLFREIEETIKITIPSNLIYRQQTSIRDSIVIKEKVIRKDINWNYKLDGSWKLGSAPFASYGEGVVVVD